MKTAILVDGGFYRRRAQNMIGECSAEQRAQDLNSYCRRHLYHHGHKVSDQRA